jgi:kynurenine formamidase
VDELELLAQCLPDPRLPAISVSQIGGVVTMGSRDAVPRGIVDLSVPLLSGMTVFPGDPEVDISPALTVEADAVNVLRVHIGSQSGTHLDAPFHVLPDGRRLDELPLDRFIGPVVVAELRDLDAEAPIGWDALGPVHQALERGVVLLLHTGWSRHHETYARYRMHPWLTADAAARIVDAGVRTIGIDALNIDATPEDLAGIRFDAHVEILGADGVIVENLTNLDAVASLADPIASVLPLHLPGADGAPVRAVAYER